MFVSTSASTNVITLIRTRSGSSANMTYGGDRDEVLDDDAPGTEINIYPDETVSLLHHPACRYCSITATRENKRGGMECCGCGAPR